MSSYTLTIATEHDRDLVVDALLAAADKRTRVARDAAVVIAGEKAAGTDVRSRSVRVIGLLGEAGTLEQLARELKATEPLVVVRYPGTVTLTDAEAASLHPVEVVEGGQVTTVAVPGDDGTSPAAQALAELAGLRPADPDAVEDELGALPEDEPVDAVEVLT